MYSETESDGWTQKIKLTELLSSFENSEMFMKGFIYFIMDKLKDFIILEEIEDYYKICVEGKGII
jgi:hypothetical protein